MELVTNKKIHHYPKELIKIQDHKVPLHNNNNNNNNYSNNNNKPIINQKQIQLKILWDWYLCFIHLLGIDKIHNFLNQINS